jgi:hypothetical protein
MSNGKSKMVKAVAGLLIGAAAGYGIAYAQACSGGG